MSDFYDVGQEQKGVQDYRIFILEIVEYLAIVAAAAFIFRVFLYSPFAIPGYSMSATLLPGDRILANRFIYGPVVPFTHKRIFNLKSPAMGEVVVFRDPSAQDHYSVKRCIGTPGARVRIENKQVFVNNTALALPATAERGSGFLIDARYSPRDNMPEFTIPKKGDYVNLEQVGLFEFDSYASLVRQENPGTRISETADLTVNGKVDNTVDLSDFRSDKRRKDGTLNFDAMDWLQLKNVVNFLEARNDSLKYGFRRTLYMDGMKLREYTVKSDAYFLMGDNWDESMDGRYTGFVSESRIEARASFIFWSRIEGDVRWRRLLRFI